MPRGRARRPGKHEGTKQRWLPIFGQGLALLPSLELDADLINYPTLEILRQTGGGLSIFTSWNHNLPTYKGFQLSGMLMPTSNLKNFLTASPLLTLKSYAIWLLHLGFFINIALEYYDALPQRMCFYQPLNLSWPMYSLKYLLLYVTIHVFLCFASSFYLQKIKF